MKVVFFHSLSHHHQKGRIFAAGMQRHGISVEFRYGDTPVSCDLAVFWSHNLPRVIRWQRRLQRRYLVMEAGYIGDRVNDWWSLGFDGLNGRANFVNDDVTRDRFNKHLKRYVAPGWQTLDGGCALLMGQVPGDTALNGLNIRAWYAAVKSHYAGSAELCFRPHPLAPNIALPGLRQLVGPMREVLRETAYTITFNSNAGVDSVIHGVPVVAMDQGSMVWDIAGHRISEPPPKPDIVEWCNKIAYAQWTPDEIERGDAWDHLKHGFHDTPAHAADSGADKVAAQPG